MRNSVCRPIHEPLGGGVRKTLNLEMRQQFETKCMSEANYTLTGGGGGAPSRGSVGEQVPLRNAGRSVGYASLRLSSPHFSGISDPLLLRARFARLQVGVRYSHHADYHGSHPHSQGDGNC